MVPKVNEKSTDKLVRLLLAAQHASSVQSLADRQALAADRRATQERMAQIQQALLRLGTKTKAILPSPQPTGCGIDFQCFRLSDGPVFRGPFHMVKPFLNWLKAVEIFFDTKGVVLDKDKICIAGGMIQETNTLAYYTANVSTHLDLSWNEFRTNLLSFVLLSLWLTKLCEQVCHLKMGESELFIVYSTHARTLRTLINFEHEMISEFDLAEVVTFSLLADLKTKLHDFQLFLASPFKYSTFEQ